jgi:hypothetical protein
MTFYIHIKHFKLSPTEYEVQELEDEQVNEDVEASIEQEEYQPQVVSQEEQLTQTTSECNQQSSFLQGIAIGAIVTGVVTAAVAFRGRRKESENIRLLSDF